MTKLEEEIKKAIKQAYNMHCGSDDVEEFEAKAAAEVCKGYIQKTWAAAERRGRYIEQLDSNGWSEYEHTDFKTWLKSEGITE